MLNKKLDNPFTSKYINKDKFKKVNIKVNINNHKVLSYNKFLKKKENQKGKIIRLIAYKLYRFKNYNEFNEVLNLMLIIFTFKSSELLVNYLIKSLKLCLKKKQFTFITFLNHVLKQYFIFYNKTIQKISGLKIQIKGKINSSQRKKVKILCFGKTPLQTINIKVNHSFENFVNKDGMFGVKVWFFYN